MDAVDRMLLALEEEANNLSAYELDQFEDMYEETFRPSQKQSLRNLRQRIGMPRGSGGGRSAGMNRALQRGNPAVLSKIAGTPSFKAQFDITIEQWTDTGTAANDALEFILFGAAQASAGYYSLFEGTRPTTVAFGGNGAYTNAQQVLITHASNKGFIKVKCETVDYPVLLQNLMVDRIIINRIRAQISDTGTAGLKTLQQQLKVKTRSLFGKAEENPISLASFKVPEQNQTGIIDIPANIPVGKDTWISGKIIAPAAYTGAASALGQTLTLSIFVDYYEKH